MKKYLSIVSLIALLAINNTYTAERAGKPLTAQEKIRVNTLLVRQKHLNMDIQRFKDQNKQVPAAKTKDLMNVTNAINTYELRDPEAVAQIRKGFTPAIKTPAKPVVVKPRKPSRPAPSVLQPVKKTPAAPLPEPDIEIIKEESKPAPRPKVEPIRPLPIPVEKPSPAIPFEPQPIAPQPVQEPLLQPEESTQPSPVSQPVQSSNQWNNLNKYVNNYDTMLYIQEDENKLVSPSWLNSILSEAQKDKPTLNKDDIPAITAQTRIGLKKFLATQMKNPAGHFSAQVSPEVAENNVIWELESFLDKKLE